MLKLSKPVLFLLVATVVAGIYLLASPAPKAPIAGKRPPKPLVKITSTQYTKEDYDANFPQPVLAARNSFEPLVMRRSGALAAALAAAGNIPAAFADGDPNWSCTGSAEVDGVRQALLENKATNDGVFVKQGDRWKSCVVSQVFEDGVTLVGPGGEAKMIRVKQETGSAEETDLLGNIPVQPELNGVIGSGGPQPGGRGQVSEVPALPAPQTVETVEDEG